MTKDSFENIMIPLVSVIIPSYNRIDTAGRTIESIIAQKCKFNFEIIIGDDCSTDGVRYLLAEYKKKHPSLIKLIFHKNNMGLGANWAICVKHCKGKYITNCDNDDYWHNPNKLQLQVDFMEAHPECDIIHTNYRTHNRNNNKIIECEANIDEYNGDVQEAFFNGKFKICNATIMYRKQVLDTHLPLDDYIKYQFAMQDWNTWIILSAFAKFFLLPVSTATFGIETESITRPKNYVKFKNRLDNDKDMYKYLCQLFPEKLSFDEDSYDNYVDFVLLNFSYNQNDFISAKKHAKKIRNRGIRSKKVNWALFPVSFHTLAILKKIRIKINDIF